MTNDERQTTNTERRDSEDRSQIGYENLLRKCLPEPPLSGPPKIEKNRPEKKRVVSFYELLHDGAFFGPGWTEPFFGPPGPPPDPPYNGLGSEQCEPEFGPWRGLGLSSPLPQSFLAPAFSPVFRGDFCGCNALRGELKR